MKTQGDSLGDLPGGQLGAESLNVDNHVVGVRIGGIAVEVLLGQCMAVCISLRHVIFGFLEAQVAAFHNLLNAVFVAGDESHGQPALPAAK